MFDARGKYEGNQYTGSNGRSEGDHTLSTSDIAQQADEELENMSRRIRMRALRKSGELMKVFDARKTEGNQYTDKWKSNGAETFPNQTQIAQQAGFSKRQQTNATRLANIPENEFEQHIEQEKPPTLTKLSEIGKEYSDRKPIERPEGF